MFTKPEVCIKDEFKEIANAIPFKHFVHVNSDVDLYARFHFFYVFTVTKRNLFLEETFS